jgi:hypothetical protein
MRLDYLTERVPVGMAALRLQRAAVQLAQRAAALADKIRNEGKLMPGYVSFTGTAMRRTLRHMGKLELLTAELKFKRRKKP